MKVCILIAAKGKDNTSIKKIATSLAKGIEEQNHMVDIIDIKLEGSKIISYYDYLIVGCEATTTFGGKIPQSVPTFLKNCGSISGKRCMAFVTKAGIRSVKTLQSLMKVMEGEGMYLKTSDVITKEAMANAIGKRLHIELN
jgi:flavodoxin